MATGAGGGVRTSAGGGAHPTAARQHSAKTTEPVFIESLLCERSPCSEEPPHDSRPRAWGATNFRGSAYTAAGADSFLAGQSGAQCEARYASYPSMSAR